MCISEQVWLTDSPIQRGPVAFLTVKAWSSTSTPKRLHEAIYNLDKKNYPNIQLHFNKCLVLSLPSSVTTPLLHIKKCLLWHSWFERELLTIQIFLEKTIYLYLSRSNFTERECRWKQCHLLLTDVSHMYNARQILCVEVHSVVCPRNVHTSSPLLAARWHFNLFRWQQQNVPKWPTGLFCSILTKFGFRNILIKHQY